MRGILSDEDYEKLMTSYDGTVNKGIRTNTLKCTPEEMAQKTPFELEPVDWCPTGYYIDSDIRPGKNPAYYAGLYYVQEPTAMTSAEALAPEPGTGCWTSVPRLAENRPSWPVSLRARGCWWPMSW